MKFTITRENLHSGLAAVAATIPTRTTLPVLSNLMLEAEGDGVRPSPIMDGERHRVRWPSATSRANWISWVS